jgi:hypothetical protein
MCDLLRRLERLEATAVARCACTTQPMWIRSLDHAGELLPDVHPQPPPPSALCTAAWSMARS